jgi:hypothetical protein
MPIVDANRTLPTENLPRELLTAARAVLQFAKVILRPQMFVLIGSGGPDMVVGRARTEGVRQTELSKRLSPSGKWSYLKLVVWGGIISILALIAYVNHVMASPPPVSAVPEEIYAAVFSAAFVIATLTCRRNSFTRNAASWTRRTRKLARIDSKWTVSAKTKGFHARKRLKGMAPRARFELATLRLTAKSKCVHVTKPSPRVPTCYNSLSR